MGRALFFCPPGTPTLHHFNPQLEIHKKLTDERHAGVGRPQLVGGHARVVSEAILGHVGHRED